MGKYVPYRKLKKIIADKKRQGKKVVLTGGCFDILHLGHIYLFRKSKEIGDILVVNVVNDERVRRYKGENRPINKSLHRARVISSLEMVDYATVHPSVDKGPTTELALIIKPDVIVKGKIWKDEEKERMKELFDYGVVLKYIRRSHFKTSTTKIIEKIKKLVV
jgi:D-beta-D-heptose 7-phosphate kinase/D-beta-D-heptose 1-phosphate adenosyltransferase